MKISGIQKSTHFFESSFLKKESSKLLVFLSEENMYQEI